MKQADLNRAVAMATGETVETIDHPEPVPLRLPMRCGSVRPLVHSLVMAQRAASLVSYAVAPANREVIASIADKPVRAAAADQHVAA
jgi:hypothetical protein